jgi:hypothetical protein
MLLHRDDKGRAVLTCGGAKYILDGGCVYDERGKQVGAAALLAALEKGAGEKSRPPLTIFIDDIGRTWLACGAHECLVAHPDYLTDTDAVSRDRYLRNLSNFIHASASNDALVVGDNPLDAPPPSLPLERHNERELSVGIDDGRTAIEDWWIARAPTDAVKFWQSVLREIRKLTGNETTLRRGSDALASAAVEAREFGLTADFTLTVDGSRDYRYNQKKQQWSHNLLPVDFGRALYEALREKSRLPDERARFAAPQDGALVVELLEHCAIDAFDLRIGDVVYEYAFGEWFPGSARVDDIGLELYRLLRPPTGPKYVVVYEYKRVRVRWNSEALGAQVTADGWLLFENGEIVVVAQAMTARNETSALVIPRSAIVKMEADE